MIRNVLSLDSLTVESFATTTSGTTLGGARPTTYDYPLCDDVAMRAPITAHTDPCDVCCQQQ